ncbi:uncharacterized protein LOC133544172 [Nerophis ophidion]|uniref:uncharacterized protein LOC133544172 n=1 Tax=Nerophis ophidion TaxID=159077 RepID=UPI002ADF8D59|nr:uncharacterized protein LOC133544172 [Nerophis ophidion]
MVTWKVEDLVKSALRSNPGPGGGPPNKLFVHQELRPRILDWGHSSLFSCHPARRHTGLLLVSFTLSPFLPVLGHTLLWISSRDFQHLEELEIAVPSTRAHIRRCQRVWRAARAALKRASEKMCRNANRHRIPAPSYQPGQQVMLLTKDLSLQRHSVVHVSQIKPVAESSLSPATPAPPPSRFLPNGDQVWTVKEILRVRRQGRGLVYLVDWDGYGPEDRSWVPASYLADPSLLEDFYRANPDAPRRSSGASHKGGGTVMTRSRTRVSSVAGAAAASADSAPRCASFDSALRLVPTRAEGSTPAQQQACGQSTIDTPELDERERHKDQQTQGTFARTSLTFPDSPAFRDQALSFDIQPDS